MEKQNMNKVMVELMDLIPFNHEKMVDDNIELGLFTVGWCWLKGINELVKVVYGDDDDDWEYEYKTVSVVKAEGFTNMRVLYDYGKFSEIHWGKDDLKELFAYEDDKIKYV